MRRVAPAALAAALLIAGCATNPQGQPTIDGRAAGAFVGAAGGALLGAQFGRGSGRMLSALVGAGAGALLGAEIGARLSAQDQARASQAASQAAVTGAPVRWTGDDGKVAGVASVKESRVETRPTAVAVRRDRIREVPPLDLVAETWTARRAVPVQGGPSGDFVTVGQLRAGQSVDVVGRVRNAPGWVLVAEGGVGSGYVRESSLARPTAPAPMATPAPAADPNVQQVTVSAARECRVIEQEITFADGQQRTETVRACNGPNGWEVVGT